MTENTALSLLIKSRGEAISYLTEYSNSAGVTTYNAWKKNFEFLNMKYMDGVVKDEYSKPKRVGYPPEFLKQIVDEGGNAIKVKKLKPEIDASYTDNINQGDECLKKKDYEKAISHYSTALDLKPSEKEPAQKIEKIKLIQNSIEDLHNTQFGE